MDREDLKFSNLKSSKILKLWSSESQAKEKEVEEKEGGGRQTHRQPHIMFNRWVEEYDVEQSVRALTWGRLMIDGRRDEFTLNKLVNKEWSEDIAGIVREIVEKKGKK